MKKRILASGLHFLVSCLFAALVGYAVFELWYPSPYQLISGGRELFLILLGVDVALGPIVMFIIFSTDKSKFELARDVTIVVLMQLAAFGYGVWTISAARPVHLVFEIDRFRVVHAIDVPVEELDKSPLGINPLPITGPSLLGVRKFKSAQEKMEATLAALQGVALSFRPGLWQSYDESRTDVISNSRSIEELLDRFHERRSEIYSFLGEKKIKSNNIRYLPMVCRNFFWTVVLDGETAEILGFLPIDSL
jgi:hypothetical protein